MKTCRTRCFDDLDRFHLWKPRWLLPKCPDGKVDVPEALAQLERGFDQTMQAGNVPLAGVTKTPAVPKLMPTLNPGPPLMGSKLRHPPSPSRVHANRPVPAGQNHAKGEAVLLRLSQHLLGKPRSPGPGVDVFRLFARNPDVVTLEEVMEAASVLPLGISRAEVQSVFAQVRGCGTGTLPLSQLTAAAEAVRNAGVPLEATGQIDAKRLAPALQRLGTKASQQEFRVALMQAEPYMTHNQMEWLSELTDKDCEGRLLPPSLLPRLGIPGAVRTEPVSWNTVPPRPIAAKGAHSVAKSLPQVLVIACLMYRIRQRLFVGSQLTLGSLLGLFDIADGSNRQQAESAVINRDLLGSLLGHLKLSISVAEADELLAAIAATAGKRSGDSGCVQVSMLYDMVDRAGQPEMETMVLELREAVRQRLWSKASCFTSAAGSAELLLETDFRRALKAAMAESWAIPGSLPEDDEDRVVLLAEKDAEGRILWRSFVQVFCGGIELDQMSEITEEPPASPSKPMGRTPGALNVGTASVNGVTAGISQQSWRTQKAAQKMEGSSTVSNKGHADPPLSPQSGQRGFCCFRRRR